MPKLSLNHFMQGAVPGDLTLAELRAYIVTTPDLKLLAEHVRSGAVRLRFLHEPGEEEFDESTKLDDFRALAAIGRATIASTRRTVACECWNRSRSEVDSLYESLQFSVGASISRFTGL